MPIIQVHDLHKSYGSQMVLKGIHFEANEGEIIGIIGKNGAGKTTFLEILMTLTPYDQGSVQLFGEHIQQLSPAKMKKLRQRISVVLQPTQFYKTLKVKELLTLFRAYYQSTVPLEDIIANFNLKPHLHKYFDKLSGGWKQIVSLAIAFLSEPHLLILDEPTTGLDPHMRNSLWNYITQYNKQTGGTVLLTTHNMDEVQMYCHKVMLLHNGVNEIFETTEQLLANGYDSIHSFYLQNVEQ